MHTAPPVLLSTLASLALATSCPAPPSTFNITAITTNAQNASVLQCWQLASPFASSATPGVAGSVNAPLGPTTNASFTVIPARFDGGLHVAPTFQYVAYLSGKAVISLPNSSATATVFGGKHGMVFAADTKERGSAGHFTRYPSTDNTAVLQMPVAMVPAYRVLHDGACDEDSELGF